ncbi:MAG TPA: methyltransferase domain-containing protein [Phenylobacterium sp.]|jgi:SAM-dependent methyltransferase|uniref:class I SAM-dependent methyltransferase n=1 Tax=Phenylobacterium sp. TaxID=1871053 RepID=UPI002D27B289|nr:methyltransferase domain-containing protein [Phenylobacterium sp.]HZZ69348.1 methyltransferase domain-containing protein [Phenylobacterium sp.]
MSFFNRLRNRTARAVYGPMEEIFRKVELSQLSRGATLEHIPASSKRGGGLGTTTYGEWCYTIGIFQSLIFQNLPARPIRMLDVGCGVGRLYLAAKPYLTSEDSYLGIDVGQPFIDICKQQYREPNVSFLHTEASNGFYAKDTGGGPKAWPLADGSHNFVTALSVWTHLREEDWCFYLKEVGRVLQPGGRAVISFFILDELYRPEAKRAQISTFYPQLENKWIFDTAAYGSEHWVYPSWASVPEVATGVPKAIFEKVVAEAGLKIANYFPGQWKDQPGFFFQDVVAFEKV